MNPGPEVLAHQDSGIFDGEPRLARDPVWEAWSLALGEQGVYGRNGTHSPCPWGAVSVVEGTKYIQGDAS